MYHANARDTQENQDGTAVNSGTPNGEFRL
jgi:hypothetical protein